MRVVALGLVAAFAGGCGGTTAGDETQRRTAPLTPDDPGRLAPEQAQAVRRLVADASSEPPAVHEGHHGHGGPAADVELSAEQQALFDAQWEAAREAATLLATPAAAADAGYTRASVQGAGVGVHWVNWTLIDAPFDVARPSMLLFDERVGRGELVGFSYWVRSPDEPDGFAGRADAWHQHANLCVVNGWVDREQVVSADDCAGAVLAGADLWMLHAWVVASAPNRWGDFATLHPALCPAERSAPDIARCPQRP